MPLAPYSNIPGRPGMTFWLPSELDVETRVVNSPRVRSFQKFTAQQRSILHDTGNPSTNALGEYNWLAGGRKGGSAGGYNGIHDSLRIFFTGMFDEIMWHGGTPEGNRTVGYETAYGAGQDWDRVLEVAVALHGATNAAFGWDADMTELHQWIYGKWCAAQVLNRKQWPAVQKAIAKATTAARLAALGGGLEVPDPSKYAKVVPIAAIDAAMRAASNDANKAQAVAPRSVLDPVSGVRFFWVGDRVRAIRDTDRDQFAYVGSPDVGGIITAGTEFDANWLFIAGDGKEWYLTPYNTRVLAENTVRISDSRVDNLLIA